MTERSLSTPGRRPYGDTAEERRWLREMIAMRQKRMTWSAIAGVMNTMGKYRRNGTPWTATGVANIVSRHV